MTVARGTSTEVRFLAAHYVLFLRESHSFLLRQKSALRASTKAKEVSYKGTRAHLTYHLRRTKYLPASHTLRCGPRYPPSSLQCSLILRDDWSFNVVACSLETPRHLRAADQSQAELSPLLSALWGYRLGNLSLFSKDAGVQKCLSLPWRLSRLLCALFVCDCTRVKDAIDGLLLLKVWSAPHVALMKSLEDSSCLRRWYAMTY